MSTENTPAAPAAAPTEGNAPAATDWMSGLDADTRGYVQNKGFKEPKDVLSSYRNFEKLMGAPKERLLTLPEKSDDPAWNDVYARLGRPEKPDGYKIDKLKEAGSEDFAKWAQETFHGLNLTDKQAEAFAEKWSEMTKAKADGYQKEWNDKLTAQQANLKKEWGQAFDQKMLGAKAAAEKFGMTGEQIDALERAMGFDGVFKFLDTIQTKIGGGDFVSGDKKQGGFNSLTPEQAQNKITALMRDDGWTKKYLAGDADAKAEMAKLHEAAYGQS